MPSSKLAGAVNVTVRRHRQDVEHPLAEMERVLGDDVVASGYEDPAAAGRAVAERPPEAESVVGAVVGSSAEVCGVDVAAGVVATQRCR
jgi:hypothetical protein